MASKKESHARKRARQRQLAILVWKSRRGVTLDEIAQTLAFEVVGSDGRVERVKAFPGDQEDAKVKQATRQQLHRDRDDLAKNGIPIEYDEIGGVYRINPADIFVPRLQLTAEESNLLVSLRCAVGQPFGPKGLLNAKPTQNSDGNAEGALTAVFARAKQQRQAVSFKHRKAGSFLTRGHEERTIVPLRFVVANNRHYVVGFDLDKHLVRGYLLSRISGSPQLIDGPHNVGDDVVAIAKAWTPRMSEEAYGARVIVNVGFAQHQHDLLGDSCEIVSVDHDADTAEIRIDFDSQPAAIMWIVANHLNVRKVIDQKLRSALKEWLAGTNRETATPVTGHSFESSFDPWSSDNSLALAFAMAAAVVTEGEMTVDQLAEKFAVGRDVVLNVFHSLVMARQSDDDNVYFLPFELGDQESDEDDNFLYLAMPESEAMFGGPDPLAWTEVFSVQLMLEQINRLAAGSPVAATAASLAEKIHGITDVSMKVVVPESPFGQQIADAVGATTLRIRYQSAGQSDASWREIVPVELQIVRGVGYVRAFEPGEGDTFKTYAVERMWDLEVVGPYAGSIPVDTHSDWLASLLSHGRPVLLEVDEIGLPVFENLPNVEVASAPTEFGFVLKVIVADEGFLDERLAMAGPHARVLGEETPRSGVAFAKDLLRTLK